MWMKSGFIDAIYYLDKTVMQRYGASGMKGLSHSISFIAFGFLLYDYHDNINDIHIEIHRIMAHSEWLILFRNKTVWNKKIK